MVEKNKIKKKNPWLAAVLNIIPGLGYLYLGRRKVFGCLLLLFLLTNILEESLNPLSQMYYNPLLLISVILMSLAFIYDAFNEAKYG